MPSFKQILTEDDEIVLDTATKAANYELSADDDWIGANADGITITLPAAPKKKRYTVTRLDAGGTPDTVDGNGASINGSATYSLSSQFSSVTVVWDGSDFWVVEEV